MKVFFLISLLLISFGERASSATPLLPHYSSTCAAILLSMAHDPIQRQSNEILYDLRAARYNMERVTKGPARPTPLEQVKELWIDAKADDLDKKQAVIEFSTLSDPSLSNLAQGERSKDLLFELERSLLSPPLDKDHLTYGFKIKGKTQIMEHLARVNGLTKRFESQISIEMDKRFPFWSDDKQTKAGMFLLQSIFSTSFYLVSLFVYVKDPKIHEPFFSSALGVVGLYLTKTVAIDPLVSGINHLWAYVNSKLGKMDRIHKIKNLDFTRDHITDKIYSQIEDFVNTASISSNDIYLHNFKLYFPLSFTDEMIIKSGAEETLNPKIQIDADTQRKNKQIGMDPNDPARTVSITHFLTIDSNTKEPALTVMIDIDRYNGPKPRPPKINKNADEVKTEKRWGLAPIPIRN